MLVFYFEFVCGWTTHTQFDNYSYRSYLMIFNVFNVMHCISLSDEPEERSRLILFMWSIRIIVRDFSFLYLCTVGCQSSHTMSTIRIVVLKIAISIYLL